LHPLVNTWLQPGALTRRYKAVSTASVDFGKPFERLNTMSIDYTWLKPAANETTKKTGRKNKFSSRAEVWGCGPEEIRGR
jgi:hypothetical protein